MMCIRSSPRWYWCKSPRADCTQSNACLPPSGRAPGPFGRISPGCPGAFGSTCQCRTHPLDLNTVVGEPFTGPPLHFKPHSRLTPVCFSRPHYESAYAADILCTGLEWHETNLTCVVCCANVVTTGRSASPLRVLQAPYLVIHRCGFLWAQKSVFTATASFFLSVLLNHIRSHVAIQYQTAQGAQSVLLRTLLSFYRIGRVENPDERSKLVCNASGKRINTARKIGTKPLNYVFVHDVYVAFILCFYFQCYPAT